MRWMVFAAILLASFLLVSLAEEAVIFPIQAIQKKGRVPISDGSSFYTFRTDETFDSGPLGSGRTISG
jgi:hypothetical protein